MSNEGPEDIRVGERARRVAQSLRSLNENGTIPEPEFEELCQYLASTPDPERRQTYVEIVALGLEIAAAGGDATVPLLSQFIILAVVASGEVPAEQSIRAAHEKIAEARRAVGSGTRMGPSLSPQGGSGLAPPKAGVGRGSNLPSKR